jgi:hypothetical protein
MQANLSMANFNINNLANPSVSTDAANKAYADLMLPLSGGTMTGVLSQNSAGNLDYQKWYNGTTLTASWGANGTYAFYFRNASGTGVAYSDQSGNATFAGTIASLTHNVTGNVVASGVVSAGGHNCLTTNTYNSYAPTLTGGNASGTWGISISGNAATSSTCSGNAATATLAAKASTIANGGGNGTAMTFNWSGQGGQPTWLWGGNDGATMYVYNPSNFSVNYANSSGSCSGNAATATTATNQSGGTVSASSAYIASLGVGTGASGTGGEIRATNNITAYFSSDARLKTNVSNIQNPLEKINQINGVEFDWTDEYIAKHGGEDGYFIRKHDVGVIAQEIERVLPEVVATKDDGSKAVKYERICALLIEAVKALDSKVKQLEAR